MPSFFLKKQIDSVVLLLLFIGLFGTVSVLQGPDINWDTLQYHYYNGYSFLHNRFRYDVAPAMLQTYYNPLLDILNYALISLEKPKLTEFLIGAFSGLNCFFVYQIATQFFIQKKLPLVCFSVLIGMTGTAGISLLHTMTNDTKMGLFVLVSLFCLQKSYEQISKHRSFIYQSSGALIGGFAAGVKLPALCYLVGLFVALAFTQSSKRWLHLLIFIFFATLGFLIADGYWMFLLLKYFKSPFFPLYNNFFQSPFAPNFSFNIPVSPHPYKAYHSLFLPFLISIKNTWITDLPFRELRFALVFIFVSLWGIKWFYTPFYRVSIQVRFFLIFFFSSYILWLNVFMVYRYLLPLEYVSGIVIVLAVTELTRRVSIQCISLVLITASVWVHAVLPIWSKKIPYDKTYFSVNPPHLPGHSVILLTSQPLAYVIPFFPPEIKFIGLPFLTVGVKPYNLANDHAKFYYLNTVISEIIQTKNLNPVFTLSYAKSDHFEKNSLEILNVFGLQEIQSECKFFSTNIGHHLKLCPISIKDSFNMSQH